MIEENETNGILNLVQMDGYKINEKIKRKTHAHAHLHLNARDVKRKNVQPSLCHPNTNCRNESSVIAGQQISAKRKQREKIITSNVRPK